MPETTIEQPHTTGKALVSDWRNACARRGWIVDRDLPAFIFQALEHAVDEALLAAYVRKPKLVKSREEPGEPARGR